MDSTSEGNFDWNSLQVSEKLDGDLSVLFYYNDQWLVASKSTYLIIISDLIVYLFTKKDQLREKIKYVVHQHRQEWHLEKSFLKYGETCLIPCLLVLIGIPSFIIFFPPISVISLLSFLPLSSSSPYCY